MKGIDEQLLKHQSELFHAYMDGERKRWMWDEWAGRLSVGNYSLFDIMTLVAERDEALNPKPCDWSEDEYLNWHGTCGVVWSEEESDEFIFCPKCGRPIRVVGNESDMGEEEEHS